MDVRYQKEPDDDLSKALKRIAELEAENTDLRAHLRVAQTPIRNVDRLIVAGLLSVPFIGGVLWLMIEGL